MATFPAHRPAPFASALRRTFAVLAATASGFALAAQAPAPNSAPIPDFQSKNVSWTAINSDFTPVPGSPAPVTFDRAHPFFRNDQARDNGGQATYRVPDPNNPEPEAVGGRGAQEAARQGARRRDRRDAALVVPAGRRAGLSRCSSSSPSTSCRVRTRSC